MRHCINCDYMQKETAQDPRSGQMYVQMYCKYSECTDPVTADPIPCSIARKEESFCGFRAKFYKKAEPVSIEDPPQSNLIMMDK